MEYTQKRGNWEQGMWICGGERNGSRGREEEGCSLTRRELAVLVLRSTPVTKPMFYFPRDNQALLKVVKRGLDLAANAEKRC